MSVTPAEQTAPTPVPSSSTTQNGHATVVAPPTGKSKAEEVPKGEADIGKPSSPPVRIVSDLPAVATTTSAASSAMLPASTAATISAPVSASASPSPTVNGLAFRSGSSPTTHLPSPRSATATATKHIPSPQTAGPQVGNWRAQPAPIHTPSNPRSVHLIKTPIMDAPGTGSPSSLPGPTSGFPSPGRENIHKLPKFVDDRTRITFGIQQALPEAVRRSVRENWEKCLKGSDFHQAFVLNATIHHATPAAVRRGIRDFGKSMVAAAKEEMIDHMTTADLDKLATRILAKASNSFLDKALEMRLKTIEAKRLINALARAERLGYEPSDVQDEGDPSSAPAPLDPSTTQYASTLHNKQGATSPLPTVPSQPLANSPSNSVPLHCNLCFRRFFGDSAYFYHIKHKVCTRTPSSPAGFKYSCNHCGQGFTSVTGLHYHTDSKVCGDFGQPSASPAPLKHQASTPVAAQQVYNSSRPSLMTQATPRQPQFSSQGNMASSSPRATAAAAAAGDPYAHLSNEQMHALQSELDAAELSYTERMRQANAILDEAERKSRLDGLSNSFGTKQSLIRKKYGVRLRMRRSKAEIIAERERMSYITSAELQAKMGILNPGSKPGRKPTVITYPTTSSRPNSSGSNGRPTSGGSGGRRAHDLGRTPGIPGQVSTPEPATTTLASSLPVPQSTTTAVEDPNYHVGMHGGAKRTYSGDGESPSHKRVAADYAEMSGLGSIAAAATAAMEAETVDPTMSKAAAAALPPPPVAASAVTPVTTAPSTTQQQQGTRADVPMTLDDSGDGDSDDSDDSSDSDEDIPAQLPTSVLQSLQHSSSRTATASPRPGSS